jgi:hypothetical protein
VDWDGTQVHSQCSRAGQTLQIDFESLKGLFYVTLAISFLALVYAALSSYRRCQFVREGRPPSSVEGGERGGGGGGEGRGESVIHDMGGARRHSFKE